MSNLDSRLRKILQDNSGYGSMSDAYVINQIKQAFEDHYNGESYDIVPHDAGYMTGKEWYEKFLLELPDQASKYAKSTVLSAARRATGVSDD